MRGESYTSAYKDKCLQYSQKKKFREVAGICLPLGSRAPLIVHGQLARFTVPRVNFFPWSGP